MGLLTFGNEPEGKWGATPALDTPKNILYYVLRRVDPFEYTDVAHGHASCRDRQRNGAVTR